MALPTELAKLVLDKCSKADLPRWTYVYDYEFVEDFQDLFSKLKLSTFGSGIYVHLLLHHHHNI